MSKSMLRIVCLLLVPCLALSGVEGLAAEPRASATSNEYRATRGTVDFSRCSLLVAQNWLESQALAARAFSALGSGQPLIEVVRFFRSDMPDSAQRIVLAEVLAWREWLQSQPTWKQAVVVSCLGVCLWHAPLAAGSLAMGIRPPKRRGPSAAAPGDGARQGRFDEGKEEVVGAITFVGKRDFVKKYQDRLGELSDRHAAVLRGRFLEGKTLRTLAEKLGITRSSVASRERTALNRLRRLVEHTPPLAAAPQEPGAIKMEASLLMLTLGALGALAGLPWAGSLLRFLSTSPWAQLQAAGPEAQIGVGLGLAVIASLVALSALWLRGFGERQGKTIVRQLLEAA